MADIEETINELVRMGDICALAIDCQKRFDSCQVSPRLCHLDWLDDRRGQFNLWTNSLNATGIGRSSLDYRVRKNPDLREMICDLLAGLEDVLSILLAQANNDISFQANSMDQDPSGADVNDASSENSNTQISESTTSDSEDAGEFSEQDFNIKNILGHLRRIATVIRRSGASYRFQHADKSLESKNYSDFKDHLEFLIRVANTPSIGTPTNIAPTFSLSSLTTVQRRLIKANVVRRNRISYAVRNMKSEGHVKVLPTESKIRPQPEEPVIMRQTTTAVTETRKREAQTDRTPKAPSVSQEATEIGSTLDLSKFKPTPRSEPSVVTRVTQIGANQEYPSCPESGPGDWFQCPFCAEILPSAYSQNPSRWRGHVAQDIMPYICIYEDCKTPECMYVTSEELLAHMRNHHSLVQWVCDYCTLKSGPVQSFQFESNELWVAHMKSVHANSYSPSKLAQLGIVSQRKSLAPVDCPLCGYSACEARPTLDEHIAQHLHDFSLRCLPWNDSEDEIKSASLPWGRCSDDTETASEAGQLLIRETIIPASQSFIDKVSNQDLVLNFNQRLVTKLLDLSQKVVELETAVQKMKGDCRIKPLISQRCDAVPFIQNGDDDHLESTTRQKTKKIWSYRTSELDPILTPTAELALKSLETAQSHLQKALYIIWGDFNGEELEAFKREAENLLMDEMDTLRAVLREVWMRSNSLSDLIGVKERLREENQASRSRQEDDKENTQLGEENTTLTSLKKEIGTISDSPLVVVPKPSPYFIGRELELGIIEKVLRSKTGHTRILITGLPGSGKTELVKHYLHQIHKGSPIVWMCARSVPMLRESCDRIRQQLNIEALQGAVPVVRLFQEIMRFLDSGRLGKWILVIDDAQIIGGSSKAWGSLSGDHSLPSHESGTIIITQSRKTFKGTYSHIRLSGLKRQDSDSLFHQCLGNVNPMFSQTSMNKLLEQLSGIPGVIIAMSSKIQSSSVTVDEMLKSLSEDQPNLLHDIEERWKEFFREIQLHDSSEPGLLEVFACFGHRDVSWNDCFWVDGISHWTSIEGDLCFDKTVSGAHRLKPYVHRALKVWMREQGMLAAAKEKVLKKMVSTPNIYPTWTHQALKLLDDDTLDSGTRISAALIIGYECIRSSQVSEALQCLQNCSEMAARTIGEQSEAFLSSQHLLAMAYHANGQISEALNLLLSVVDRRRTLLSPTHLNLLASQHELGGVYLAHGAISTALEILEGVVRVRNQLLSKNDPDLLSSQHELARVYRYKGGEYLAKSQALLESVVATRIEVLGHDDPNVLASQHELARTYHMRGRHDAAVLLLEAVVSRQNELLPRGHLDRLASLHALGLSYYAAGQLFKALQVLREVSSTDKNFTRPNHPSRLATEEVIKDFLRGDSPTPLDLSGRLDVRLGRDGSWKVRA